MSDQPESLAAILAEMRLDADILVFPTLTPDKLRTYADRVEAAAKREREAYCDLCKDKDATIDRLLVERDRAIKARAPGNAAAQKPVVDEDTSDGYHTFRELYRYRMLYNAAFFNALAAHTDIPVVKSHRHSDGEPCFGGGWFIVTAQLPTGQVSNHYEDKDWPLFCIPVVECPPKWDGHTPNDAADRIEAYLREMSLRGDNPGNAAALREALEKFLDFSRRGLAFFTSYRYTEAENEEIEAAFDGAKAALAAPARNCDVGTANDLHAAFVRHCDACNPPGGCCHRSDTRGMLDTGCASILKCFARFALDTVEGGAK